MARAESLLPDATAGRGLTFGLPAARGSLSLMLQEPRDTAVDPLRGLGVLVDTLREGAESSDLRENQLLLVHHQSQPWLSSIHATSFHLKW